MKSTPGTERVRSGLTCSKRTYCIGADHDGTTGTRPLLVVYDHGLAGLLGPHRDAGDIGTGKLFTLPRAGQAEGFGAIPEDPAERLPFGFRQHTCALSSSLPPTLFPAS